MRREQATAALTVGAIILLVGLLMFFSQGSTLAECQTFLGQLGRALSADLQQRCSTASTLRTLGALGGAGGAILALVGGVGLASAQPRAE